LKSGAVDWHRARPAGITDRLWSLEDIAERIEANRPQPTKRGPYKKRIQG
jgi:hypothetical protein